MAEEWEVVWNMLTEVHKNVVLRSSLFSALMEKRLITYDDAQEIKAAKTDRDKLETLIGGYLAKRGPGSLGKFLEALRKDDQRYIADEISSRKHQPETLNSSESSSASPSQVPPVIPAVHAKKKYVTTVPRTMRLMPVKPTEGNRYQAVSLAISATKHIAISSAKDVFFQVSVYTDNIEAVTLAISSERMEKLVKILQGTERSQWKTLLQWVIAGGDRRVVNQLGDAEQLGKQKSLCSFLEEMRERHAATTEQFNITMETLKDARKKRDEAEALCNQTTALLLIDIKLSCIVALYFMTCSVSSTVWQDNGLIDMFKNFRRPLQELFKYFNNFENILLESDTQMRSIGEEVQKMAVATANQSPSLDVENVCQCLMLLARKAKPLQDQHTDGVRNVKEMAVQISALSQAR